MTLAWPAVPALFLFNYSVALAARCDVAALNLHHLGEAIRTACGERWASGRRSLPLVAGAAAWALIGATLPPHNIGLGAANDPELIRELGRVTAREVAVTGQDWDFGPTIAVARDDDLSGEAVPVQTAALVGLGQQRQQVRGLELEGFSEFNFHGSKFKFPNLSTSPDRRVQDGRRAAK